MIKPNYFLNFHRSPDDGWEAGATFDTPEAAAAAMTKAGYNIRTAEQEKTFLENATKTARSESAKEERRMLLDGLDGSFKELTGIEKEAGMKTNDYITGLFKNMMDSNKKVSSEFETFKTSKLSESAAAKEQKAISDKAAKVYKDKQAELMAENTQLRGQQFNFKVDLSVKEAMNRISPTLKKMDNIEDSKQVRVMNFHKNFKVVEHEGALIVHDLKDDSPVLDSTNGNPLSIYDVLSKQFESLVDQGRKQEGNGANDKTPGADGKVNKNNLRLELPADVKTQKQLLDYIESGKVTIDGNVVEAASPLSTQLFMVNRDSADGTRMPR